MRIPLTPSRYTYVFLGINLFLYLAMAVFAFANPTAQRTGLQAAMQSISTGNANALVQFGANVAQLVSNGEYWRLIAANFLHIGLLHIALNSYSLYWLGRNVEGLFGSPRFIVIYILSGISGAIFSYWLTQGFSAGASTSIFGLFGAFGVFLLRYREQFGEFGKQQLNSLGITLAINVVYGLSPGSSVDNWGHFGGVIGGAILAYFLVPKYQFAPNTNKTQDANPIQKQIIPIAIFCMGLVALTLLAQTMQRRLPF